MRPGLHQVSSVAQSCPTLCDPVNRSTPGLPVHHQLLEFTQTRVHRVSDAIQPSHPLSSPSPPALNLSQDQGLFNGSALHIRWPKCWSLSFSISPSNEYLGLISIRMDCLDLLAVQGTLKSLLQHYSSKASILRHSAFFIVQLSHPYMATGKTIALTRRTFVGKVIRLLFNTLSRFVITFLPRSKRLLISWLQSPPAATFLESRQLAHCLLLYLPSAGREVVLHFRLNVLMTPQSQFIFPLALEMTVASEIRLKETTNTENKSSNQGNMLTLTLWASVRTRGKWYHMRVF